MDDGSGYLMSFLCRYCAIWKNRPWPFQIYMIKNKWMSEDLSFCFLATSWNWSFTLFRYMATHKAYLEVRRNSKHLYPIYSNILRIESLTFILINISMPNNMFVRQQKQPSLTTWAGVKAAIKRLLMRGRVWDSGRTLPGWDTMHCHLIKTTWCSGDFQCCSVDPKTPLGRRWGQTGSRHQLDMATQLDPTRR